MTITSWPKGAGSDAGSRTSAPWSNSDHQSEDATSQYEEYGDENAPPESHNESWDNWTWQKAMKEENSERANQSAHSWERPWPPLSKALLDNSQRQYWHKQLQDTASYAVPEVQSTNEVWTDARKSRVYNADHNESTDPPEEDRSGIVVTKKMWDMLIKVISQHEQELQNQGRLLNVCVTVYPVCGLYQWLLEKEEMYVWLGQQQRQMDAANKQSYQGNPEGRRPDRMFTLLSIGLNKLLKKKTTEVQDILNQHYQDPLKKTISDALNVIMQHGEASRQTPQEASKCFKVMTIYNSDGTVHEEALECPYMKLIVCAPLHNELMSALRLLCNHPLLEEFGIGIGRDHAPISAKLKQLVDQKARSRQRGPKGHKKDHDEYSGDQNNHKGRKGASKGGAKGNRGAGSGAGSGKGNGKGKGSPNGNNSRGNGATSSHSPAADSSPGSKSLGTHLKDMKTEAPSPAPKRLYASVHEDDPSMSEAETAAVSGELDLKHPSFFAVSPENASIHMDNSWQNDDEAEEIRTNPRTQKVMKHAKSAHQKKAGLKAFFQAKHVVKA